jgi:ER-bound oxygenase mpaB/B'/Rubber oxygenase, catalytic domain
LAIVLIMLQPLTPELLAASRLVTDPLADQAVGAFFAQAAANAAPDGTPAQASHPQWAALAQTEAGQALWQATAELPAWANPALLAQGAAFFDQHAQTIMSLLGFLSLPYCYAAADGARVLYRSERIQADTTRRLAETAHFVLSVTGPAAFAPGGPGFEMVRQVRLMHAAVRYHIGRGGRWDAAAWGPPINQEDMAGTNLAFSFIVLRGLRRLGIAVDPAAAQAYLHLWNVVGWLLGVGPALLPTTEREADRLDRLIAARHFKKSEVGVALTASLVASIEQTFKGTPPGRIKGFVPAYMRYLMGDAVADLLELPPAGWLPGATVRLLAAYQAFNRGRGLSRAEMLANIHRNHGAIAYPLPQQVGGLGKPNPA